MRLLGTTGQAESHTGGEERKDSHYSSALLPMPTVVKYSLAGRVTRSGKYVTDW
jgi:hypothetical protein